MYLFPTRLPKFSNREDFLLPVSLFDDNTALPIDVSGVTLAVPGAPFTSNAWTVIDGAIVTNSATQITIPPFPLGNQLSALALTVGLNLGILAGDPITIKDTATGQNQMAGYVTSYNAATGALVVQIGLTFNFEIRHWRRPGMHGFDDGYSVSPSLMGTIDDSGPIISAQLGNGILITDVGYLQILIPVSTFGMLHERTYLAGLNMTDSINTRQIFIGELPVQWGALSRNPPGTTSNAAFSAIF